MEINGLPLHPLVVHAAVVFGPLGALAALAYASLPKWRDRLRWPMVVVALIAGGAIVTAYFSGKNFIESRPELEAIPALQTHMDRGQQLFWVTLGFSAIAIVACWFHTQTGAVRAVLNVLLGASALGMLVLVFLTGEAGARSVWG